MQDAINIKSTNCMTWFAKVVRFKILQGNNTRYNQLCQKQHSYKTIHILKQEMTLLKQSHPSFLMIALQ